MLILCDENISNSSVNDASRNVRRTSLKVLLQHQHLPVNINSSLVSSLEAKYLLNMFFLNSKIHTMKIFNYVHIWTSHWYKVHLLMLQLLSFLWPTRQEQIMAAIMSDNWTCCTSRRGNMDSFVLTAANCPQFLASLLNELPLLATAVCSKPLSSSRKQ